MLVECNPYKVLIALYLIMLVTIVGLYRWQPISPILMVPNIALSDWSHQPISCWDSLSEGDQLATNCELDNSKGNILLFGDSHAQQLVFGFKHMQSNDNAASSKKLIFLTSQLMKGNWRSPLFYKDPQVKYISSMLTETTERDVIIFSITSGHLEDSVYGNLRQEGRLQIDLAELMSAIFHDQIIKGKIILMLDTPHLKNNVARICSVDQGYKKKLCRLNFADYELQNSYLIGAYAHLKNLSTDHFFNPIVLDPSSLFCQAGECSLFDDSGFMLIDGNHIKMLVSQKLVEELFFDII
jgi:hypothetical protein